VGDGPGEYSTDVLFRSRADLEELMPRLGQHSVLYVGAKDVRVGCRAGLEVMGIESNGDVKGCLSLPSGLNGRHDFVEGNLRTRRLPEIWNDPNAFAYNRQFRTEDLQGKCAGCAFGEICRGGCTWTSVALAGHPHDFPHCFYKITSTRSSTWAGVGARCDVGDVAGVLGIFVVNYDDSQVRIGVRVRSGASAERVGRRLRFATVSAWKQKGGRR
jgi:radical SAM protein with 4Fe4S-binding SPASM domain